jgi:hypothetical protein
VGPETGLDVCEEIEAAHAGIRTPDRLARSLVTTKNTIPATQLHVLWETFRRNIHFAKDFDFLYNVNILSTQFQTQDMRY